MKLNPTTHKFMTIEYSERSPSYDYDLTGNKLQEYEMY